MTIPFNRYISESFDKFYPFEKTKPSVAYVKAQYQFEAGSYTYGVRYNKSKLGSMVSDVVIGKFTGIKFSYAQLTVVPNFKMFLSTVAQILKTEADDKNTKAKWKKGIVLTMNSSFFEKAKSLIMRIIKLMLLGQYKVKDGFHWNEDPDLRSIYIYKQGAMFSQVFKNIPEDQMSAALNANTVDSYSVKTTEAPKKSDSTSASDVFNDVKKDADVTKPQPSMPFADGFYKFKGELMYFKVSSKDEYTVYRQYPWGESKYKLETMKTAFLGAAPSKFFNEGSVWPNCIWHSGISGNWDDVLTLSDFPGSVWAFNFTTVGLGATKLTVEQALSKGCFPSTISKPTYEAPLFGIVKVNGSGSIKLSAFKVMTNPNQNIAKSFVVGTQPSNTASLPLAMFPIRHATAMNMVASGLIPSDGPLMQAISDEFHILSKQSSGQAKPAPVIPAVPTPDKEDSPSLASIKKGPPMPWTYEAVKKVPKLSDKVKPEVIERTLDLFNVRSSSTRNKAVDIGPMSIKLGGSLVEVRETFEKIANMSQGKRTEMYAAIDRYLQKTNNSAYGASIWLNESTIKDGKQFKDKGMVKALQSYTGSGYSEINKFLRQSTKPLDLDLVKERIAKLDALFLEGGVRLPKDTVVYRGQSLYDSEIADLKGGGVVHNPAYMSTTLNSNTASGFLGAYSISSASFIAGSSKTDYSDKMILAGKNKSKVLMSIDGTEKVPVLVPGKLSNHEGESEVVLPRGTILRLSSAPDSLVEVDERVYLGHFTVEGLYGVPESLAEYRTQRLTSFRAMLESMDTKSNNMVNSLYAAMMMARIAATAMSPAEKEELYNFYLKMDS